MKKAALPVERAIEPNEGARQIMMSASQNSLSQNSSILTMEELSLPASELSQRGRLEWLQVRRRPGLWAQCDECSRWRYLPTVHEPHDLPPLWFCRLNPDPAFADCSVPEKQIRVRQEEDLIHGDYAAGSVVWARMAGYPWWPAMVCDCPDTEQFYWLDGFSDIPTHYNVVFFDEVDVTRAWIVAEQIKPYEGQKKEFKLSPKDKKYKSRINTAIKLADDAKNLQLSDRLAKYSFIARYKGPIHSPKDNKREIKKQQLKLKKKLQLNCESESDSDFEMVSEKRMKKNKAKIILGSRSPNKKANMAKKREATKKKEKVLKSPGNKNKRSVEPEGKDQTLKSPGSKVKRSAEPDKDQTDGNEKNAHNTDTDATIQISEKSPTKKHHLEGLKFNAKNKGPSAESGAMKKMLKVKFFEEQVLGIESQADKTNYKGKYNETCGTVAKTQSSEFKQHTSLAVQVGSKDSVIQNFLMADESFDNDTSKTYVPGPTETTPGSPDSDDFEY